MRHPLRMGAALALSIPLAAGAQSRTLVVKLGVDTFQVERVVRSGNRIDGTIARHLPAAGLFKYSLTLNADGTIATYEQGTYRGDGSPMPANAQTGASTVGLSMTFTTDSVVRNVPINGQVVSRRNAAPKGTLPAMPGSWFAYEFYLAAARRDGKVNVITFGANANAPNSSDFRLIGTDSAESVAQGFRIGLKYDRNGFLTHGDGSLTTQKFDARPGRDADVTTLASAWAAKETPGAPPSPLSTADTAIADIGGAHVVITYGRPAARGREIWGKLVPWDTTWRLGANFATQLKTDKDLDVGGTTVLAGAYTLWLFPSAGQSYLIVNKQTIDPANPNRALWGTGWDPAQDVAKIAVEKHMNLSTSEERLHIFFQGDMLMMHWAKGGYGVRVKAK